MVPSATRDLTLRASKGYEWIDFEQECSSWFRELASQGKVGKEIAVAGQIPKAKNMAEFSEGLGSIQVSGWAIHPITQGTKTPSLMPWIFFLSAGTIVARQPPKDVSPSSSVKK